MLTNFNVWNDPLWNELDRTLAAFARPASARRRRPRRHVHPVAPERAPAPRAGQLWARRAEDGGAYLVSVDLPGVRADGLTVEVEGRALTLKAQRADERGVYQHALTLPEDALATNATADLTDGVLTLTIPRKAEDQPRRLAITVAGELPPAAETKDTAGEPEAKVQESDEA